MKKYIITTILICILITTLIPLHIFATDSIASIETDNIAQIETDSIASIATNNTTLTTTNITWKKKEYDGEKYAMQHYYPTVNDVEYPYFIYVEQNGASIVWFNDNTVFSNDYRELISGELIYMRVSNKSKSYMTDFLYMDGYDRSNLKMGSYAANIQHCEGTGTATAYAGGMYSYSLPWAYHTPSTINLSCLTELEENPSDNFYRDWYFAKYGENPDGTKSFIITITYTNNSIILKTDSMPYAPGALTLSEIITAPDGYEIEKITINDSEYRIDEMTTFSEQTEIFVECKIKVSGGLTGGLPDATLLDNTKLILSEQLAGNKLYTSSMMLVAELENLFNQDYNDKNEFKKINPFKITAGNLAIPTEGTGSYHYSQINWGLNNQEVLNFDWFFGNHPSAPAGLYVNIDGTPAVKAYSDPIISAFMWIIFAWRLWHNLPDLVSGTVGSITDLTANTAKNKKKGD